MASTIIFTSAYNAEKTLRRTIKSVLSQTRGDFVYYLADNGSTDKTRQIIDEYAQQDNRIVPMYQDINNVRILWELFPFFCSDRQEEYFTIVDADDVLKPEYLEQLLGFIQKETLDVAACGNDMIDARSDQLVWRRLLPGNLVLEGTAFGLYFPQYHQFMRTNWCKVFKISLLRRCQYKMVATNVTYGGDTLFTTETFRNAKRVGILAMSLHCYYISSHSASYRLDNPKSRVASDRILHQAAVDFLNTKSGEVSALNYQFLLHVYFNAIKDTISVVIHSELSVSEKLEALRDIFTASLTLEIRQKCRELESEFDRLAQTQVEWFLTHQAEAAPSDYEKFWDILSATNSPAASLITVQDLPYISLKLSEIIRYFQVNDFEQILNRIKIWGKKHNPDIPCLSKIEIYSHKQLNRSDEDLFQLLLNMRKKRPVSCTELHIDQQILNLISQTSLLRALRIEVVVAISPVILRILRKDYSKAMELFLSALEQIEISEQEKADYLQLGQNLAAICEDGALYIYFKKLWISYLIHMNQIQEAHLEVKEFENILPDDEDFIMFRRILAKQGVV